jgi:branched-chain amino acid transport system ATP-binding protein
MAEEIGKSQNAPIASPASLLSLRGLTRRFGGLTAVDGIYLDLAKGDLVSIIGPNGAGKTTLFNLVTGLDRPDGGEVRLDGQVITGFSPERLAGNGIARTFQLGRVFGNLSVMDNVLIGAHTRLRAVKPAIPLIGPLLELGLALLRPAAVKAEEEQLRDEVRGVLARFGERLLPRIDQPAYSLSYANRRRLEIARALALRPRLLLLDEPTAGMNPTETTEMQALVAELKAEGLTILLIEHKLDMVVRLSDRVIVMDEGKKIAEGAREDVRNDARVIEEYLGHGLSQPAADARETAA